MGSLTLQWNPQQILERPTSRALKAATDDLAQALQAQFKVAHWSWPGVTERKSGEVAGSTRDIFDTGTLAGSQQRPVQITDTHYRIEWTADYAAAVFLGAVFKTRNASLPARNVAYGAFQTFNLAESFARHWRFG